MRYSLNQRVRERAGFGLLRIRLKVAHLTGEGRRDRVSNYDVPDRFLEATSTEPSRAHIDVNADKFRAKYPGRLIGITRDQVVEGMGLLFEASSVASAFDLTVEQSEDGARRGDVVNDQIAMLSPAAKPATKRDKPFADEAAKLIRSGKTVADALRQVRPSDPARQDESIDRGIRACLDLHYAAGGTPLA